MYGGKFECCSLIITGRNEVVAKVMFLQACVCPQGGVSASVHAGIPPQTRCPPPHPPDQTQHHHPPGTRQTPPGPGRPPRDQAEPPPPTPPLDLGRPPPGPDTLPSPGSRLQQTVYEWPVRILLECILVMLIICSGGSRMFPERDGSLSPKGARQPIIWPNLAENQSQKLHENEENWTGGHIQKFTTWIRHRTV